MNSDKKNPFAIISWEDEKGGRIYFLLDDKLPINDRAICESDDKEELKSVVEKLNKIWEAYCYDE